MYTIGGNSWTVATEALTTLAQMDNCNTSAVDSMLSSIGDIDPGDFTKQLAKTRAEIFQLFKTLLGGGITEARQRRDYLPKILSLAMRERDPTNLLCWFQTLSGIIRASKLSANIVDSLFESLSPFFPISIRESTIPGRQVPEKVLKEALRSCFASNGQLAHRVMPFLLGKLDDGTASITVSVKVCHLVSHQQTIPFPVLLLSVSIYALPVPSSFHAIVLTSFKLDILETIEACVAGYEPTDTYVFPYIPQIWSSLKYEVRNGEAPEAIQATLSVFETVSRRLASSSSSTNLKEFVELVWNDSSDDLVENPAYTEQLGSILISVARAHSESFLIVSPRLVKSIQRAIDQPKSPSHTKSLLLVLNNLLRVRRGLASHLSTRASSATDNDGSVSLLRAMLFKVFNENAAEDPNTQQTALAEEALVGLEQIVMQRRLRYDGVGYVADCDEDAFKEICATLSFRYLNCFNRRLPLPGSTQEGFEYAVGQALRTTVQHYPMGYGKIVTDVLDDVKKTNWTGSPAKRSLSALSVSCMRLAHLGCTAVPENTAAIVNFATFAGGMLKMLGILFASKANFKACAHVAAALLKGVRSFTACAKVRPHLDVLKQSDKWEETWCITSVDAAVKDMLPTFPDLANGLFNQFDPVSLTESLTQALFTAPTSEQQAFAVSFLQIGIVIVRQLYQHATRQLGTAETVQIDLSEPLVTGFDESDDRQNSRLWRDRYLSMVGSIAAAVLRELNLSAQMDMELHMQILACFRPVEGRSQQLSWNWHCSTTLSELSWGIAHAIRPEVVLNLVSTSNSTHSYALLITCNQQHGDIGRLLLPDSDEDAGSLKETDSRITAIATLLANKYNTRSPGPLEEACQKHEAWIRVLTKIEGLLREPNVVADMPAEKLVSITGILWGAIARGDRFITKGLQDAITHAAAKSGSISGNAFARLLARIFLPLGRFLDPTFTPAFIISKPLQSQRAYYHCVQPVLSDAYPLSTETEDAVCLAIYVLHAVKRLHVDQYEQDADRIFRIALTAMKKAKYVEDLDAAATIVHHIIYNRTKLADHHWNTVLEAERAMYHNAHPFQNDAKSPNAATSNNPWMRNTSIRPETEDDRTELRKKSLRLSALVAKKVDRTKGPENYAMTELMHLTTASADKTREVRALVQKTRNDWLRQNSSTTSNED